jgi:hypothetical protein
MQHRHIAVDRIGAVVIIAALFPSPAWVAKSVDAADSKSAVGDNMTVRVRPQAPIPYLLDFWLCIAANSRLPPLLTCPYYPE